MQNFELRLAPGLLARARVLAEKGLLDCTEVEDQVWEASFQGQEETEAEAWMAGNRVRTSFCNCADFTGDNYCIHLAALLLYLKAQREQRRRKPAPIVPPADKLTVSRILRHVPPEELQAFVARYARKDSRLALSLRTAFAARVPTRHEERKYEEIVNRLLKTIGPARKKNSLRQQQMLYQFSEELLERAAVHLSETDLVAAVSICLELLARILPLCLKADEQSQLALHGRDIELMAIKLAGHDLPPELRDRFDTGLLQVVRSPWYRPAYPDSQLFGPVTMILPAAEQEALASLKYEQWGAYSDSPAGMSALLVISPVYLPGGRERHWSIADWRIFTDSFGHTGHLRLPADKWAQLICFCLPLTGRPAALEYLCRQSQDICHQAPLLDLRASLYADLGDPVLLKHIGESHGPLFADLLWQQVHIRSDYMPYYRAVDALGLPGHAAATLQSGPPVVDMLPGLARFHARDLFADHLDTLVSTMLHYLDDHYGQISLSKLQAILAHLQEQGTTETLQQVLSAVGRRFPARSAVRKICNQYQPRVASSQNRDL